MPESIERLQENISDIEQILVIGEEKRYGEHTEIYWHLLLYENNRLQKKDIPIYDASQGRRYLLNVVPKHSYGRDFDAMEKIDEGIYLHTSY